MNKSLKIIPLGGMGKVTKNMFVYETSEEILLVDCGIGFPDPTMLGVDLLLPDVSYLKESKKRIVGMLLTHPHDDHIAGLPYVLPDLPVFPIYGSRLTAGFAKDRCKDFGIDVKINPVGDQEFKVGSFTVLPIKVTHSVPDSRHFGITCPAGTVYHGSDFKFDSNPVDGVLSEKDKIKSFGERGVDLLLSDSLRSERKGRSSSESLLRETFEQEIVGVKGKFIVTVMSSNIHRIQLAVDVATKHGRQVAFLGRSIEKNVETAQNLGFLKLPNRIVDKREIEKIDPRSVCVLIAGSQGQEGSSLKRASQGDHDLISFKPDDKVVFATEPIPGNEVNVYEAIDNIARLEADIAYSDINEETLHVSGHASADELVELINLTKPKYLLPIGGAYRHMVQYKKLATTIGYQPNMVIILKDGQTVLYEDETVKLGENIDLKEVIVDGLGIGDVGTRVLEDRRQMAEAGIVVIAILVSGNKGTIVGSPEIVSRGFVYMKHAGKLTKKITQEVNKNLPKALGKKDWSEVRRRVERRIERLIYKETRRTPLVLSVIKQV
jgi:ribonuclease J